MATIPSEPYTPKYSFKQVINECWNEEEYGYNPIHIDRVIAITAASMWREVSKIAPEKWYTRLATELKKFVQANRRRFNALEDKEIEQIIQTEWASQRHVANKRALLSSAPLYKDFDGDYVLLEPVLADNFRKNLLLPGETPVDLSTFAPSKQTLEKIAREEQILKEREELMQAVLEGRRLD